jgi:hypothetical protein
MEAPSFVKIRPVKATELTDPARFLPLTVSLPLSLLPETFAVSLALKRMDPNTASMEVRHDRLLLTFARA